MPEVFGQLTSSNASSDVFGLGTVLYLLIFSGSSSEFLKFIDAKIKAGIFEFEFLYGNQKGKKLQKILKSYTDLSVQSDIPPSLHDLFKKMVFPCAQSRITLSGIMKHPFFYGVDWKALGAL